MPAKDPRKVAEDWSRGMSGSTQKIKAGVQAVTESPTAKAADAVDRMVAGVIRAQQSGKTERALRAVSLDDWKRAFIEKGLQRIASGATTGKAKMAAFLQDWLPHVEQVRASLPPRGDMQQNIARMVANVEGLANFKKS